MKPRSHGFSPVLRLLVFGAVGVAGGFMMMSAPDSQARTPQGVSGRDFANLVACCEENDAKIVAILDILIPLEADCILPTGSCYYQPSPCEATVCEDLTETECDALGGEWSGELCPPPE